MTSIRSIDDVCADVVNVDDVHVDNVIDDNIRIYKAKRTCACEFNIDSAWSSIKEYILNNTFHKQNFRDLKSQFGETCEKFCVTNNIKNKKKIYNMVLAKRKLDQYSANVKVDDVRVDTVNVDDVRVDAVNVDDVRVDAVDDVRVDAVNVDDVRVDAINVDDVRIDVNNDDVRIIDDNVHIDKAKRTRACEFNIDSALSSIKEYILNNTFHKHHFRDLKFQFGEICEKFFVTNNIKNRKKIYNMVLAKRKLDQYSANVKVDDVRIDAVNIDDVRVDAVNVDDVRVDAVNVDDVRNDAVNLDDVHVDNVINDNVRIDKVKRTCVCEFNIDSAWSSIKEYILNNTFHKQNFRDLKSQFGKTCEKFFVTNNIKNRKKICNMVLAKRKLDQYSANVNVDDVCVDAVNVNDVRIDAVNVDDVRVYAVNDDDVRVDAVNIVDAVNVDDVRVDAVNVYDVCVDAVKRTRAFEFKNNIFQVVTKTPSKHLIACILEKNLKAGEELLNAIQDDLLPCKLVLKNKRFNLDTAVFYAWCKFKMCRQYKVVFTRNDGKYILNVTSNATSFNHEGKLVGQLRGKKRIDMMKILKNKHARVVRHECIMSADDNLIKNGNLQNIYSTNVLRRVQSEAMAIHDESKDDLL